jgi:putative membrane protein
MNRHRKPAAFKIEQQMPQARKTAEHPPRKPRSTRAVELITGEDVFDREVQTFTPEPIEPASRKRTAKWSASGIFLSATGLLLSLAIGLWLDTLVRNLFSRSDWLGYAAIGILSLAIITLLIIIFRELAGLAHLKAAGILRELARDAASGNDSLKARTVIEKLENLFASTPQTARSREILKSTRSEVISGADLIKLAEHTLLKPLDEIARTIILDSAKRVSVVTAVSPRALIDVAYVIFECARLIRRLAELYGGRPGTLGLIRLSKNVVTHLAVTGSIAIGDSVIQQLVGHGLAAKISTRLGEGVINGLMTARVGISAIDIVRPMEFTAEKRPSIGDFLSDITKLTREK